MPLSSSLFASLPTLSTSSPYLLTRCVQCSLHCATFLLDIISSIRNLHSTTNYNKLRETHKYFMLILLYHKTQEYYYCHKFCVCGGVRRETFLEQGSVGSYKIERERTICTFQRLLPISMSCMHSLKIETYSACESNHGPLHSLILCYLLGASFSPSSLPSFKNLFR